MSSTSRNPGPGGEIRPIPSFPMFDEERGNREFLVVTIEKEMEISVPFLANYETAVDAGKFKRLIAYEHKADMYHIVKIENQTSDVQIFNENGKLKFVFSTHVFGINTEKILEKMSGYQDDLNKVVVEEFPFENIPNKPQYYNRGYKILIPENFDVFRDQQYIEVTGQDGVEFKGIFSLDQPELKLPTEHTGDTYEFYTTSGTYAVFRGYENKRIYAIPVLEKVKCYVDTNYGRVRMANVCNLTFNVNYGILSVGEMEINTVNICGKRAIIGNTIEEVINIGISRLNEGSD
ncbi:hypothetical protein [Cryptosporidium parvum Iowa II]|uniref:Uncharacterized protein n=2 Tax=Cryptosporidium parvum TaxID=5807 RepID=Q5CQ14_CRYPI|nr:hypothetical protein [Cryptosporidium parvum Iowa II]EAK87454.1 uncharacterized protein cgd8_10 [Cryptosporidium parvum Iowa II]WKS79247.1 hypothetical protein CPCDC_8g10 [Cryptosporidium sp. 43IA8]